MYMVEMIAHDPISQRWTAETRAQYVGFSQHLMHWCPLLFDIGNDGMRYTLPLDGAQIFICHFNAQPRNRNGVGVSDFRYDALRKYLDVEAALKALSQAAPPEIQIKPHKLSCSLQFPLTSANTAADLLRQQIVAKITGKNTTA